MKKQYTHLKRYALVGILVLVFALGAISQVGINTITPGDGSILDITSSNKGIFIPKVSISDLGAIAPITGVANNPTSLLLAEGLLVYNTSSLTGPGYFYWTGTQWDAVSNNKGTEPGIDSVSLAADVLITSTSYVNIPLTITFTARKTSALVTLTASGIGYTNSIATAFLTVQNTTSGVNLGGMQSKIQNHSSVAVFGIGNANSNNSNLTYSTTSWSGSFSKLMTGLTIGQTYTLSVRGKSESILGTNGFAIQPVTTPESQHLTISVMQ